MPLHTLTDDPELAKSIPVSTASADPSLLLFYHHLRKSYQSMRFNQPLVPSVIELQFIYESACAYERLGLPVLALDIIRKCQTFTHSKTNHETNSDLDGTLEDRLRSPVTPSSELELAKVKEPSAGSDWSEPVSKVAQSSSAFDWSEPVSTTANQSSGGFDWGEPVAMQPQKSSAFDWGEPTSSTANKADDMDWLSEPVSTQNADITALAAPVAKGNDSIRLILGKRNFRLYQWVLAMRIVQAACHAAQSVSRHWDILKSDSLFKNYFVNLKDGFKDLCELVGMPVPVMEEILEFRCKEMDKLVAYMEILPFKGSSSHYKEMLVEFATEQSNTLARLVLVPEQQHSSYRAHIMEWAKFLLWSLVRWHEKDPVNSDTWDETKNALAIAGVSSFICLTICFLKDKSYKMLYLIIAQSMPFLELLMAGNIEALQGPIRDILFGQTGKVCFNSIF